MRRWILGAAALAGLALGGCERDVSGDPSGGFPTSEALPHTSGEEVKRQGGGGPAQGSEVQGAQQGTGGAGVSGGAGAGVDDPARGRYDEKAGPAGSGWGGRPAEEAPGYPAPGEHGRGGAEDGESQPRSTSPRE